MAALYASSRGMPRRLRGAAAYPLVRRQVLEGTALCSVQSINHDPNPERRDAALKTWVQREAAGGESAIGGEPAMSWFEDDAASSDSQLHPTTAAARSPFGASVRWSASRA